MNISLVDAQLGVGEPSLSDEAVWFGKNGKALRGVFIKEQAGEIHVFDMKTGKLYKLREETLAPKTVDWYKRMKAKRDAGGAPAPARPQVSDAPSVPLAPPGFERLDAAKLDRSTIPVVDQAKYGQKASDCVPNAYAAFFLWWDRDSNLPIPKGRDFEDKAEWIHKELARRFVTRNNSGTSYRKLEEGLLKYFQRYHEGTARFEFGEDFDIRPASLAKYATGDSCTVLTLTIYHGDRVDGGHAVSLLSAKPDGSVVFNTWGQSFTGKIESIGKLKERERVPKPSSPRERFEIKLAPDSKLTEYMKRYSVRFVLDPTQWDSVQVLTPYVKTK